MCKKVEVQETSYLSQCQSKNRRRISDLPRQRASTLPQFETIYVHTFVASAGSTIVLSSYGFWSGQPPGFNSCSGPIGLRLDYGCR